ncbi:hypothetical protein IV38_GL000563 [Lactobacillus selangorensis]|uniref:Uncharacterized protein n=1 Tax=Lactobacillus selangorensis TaxID=81857 RepID=A0A0R2FWK9_9LACO|nr:hypothetical protein IV38_GL000563 [Lactobacillus selangorensis]KRN33795.1 hypothetical protein IV40_GL000105 [Lactobacillus selangorensis]
MRSSFPIQSNLIIAAPHLKKRFFCKKGPFVSLRTVLSAEVNPSSQLLLVIVST